MSVAEDLIAVRSLLILRGRSTSDWEDEDGRVCLGNAIDKVADLTSDRGKDVCESLVPHMPPEFSSWADDLAFHRRFGCQLHLGVIANYNDDCAKDDQDVFDVIEKALAELGAAF